MKQNLDDTQLQLQDSANRYFSDLNGSRPIRDTQPARWRDYLDFGWLSLSVPQAQDGSGLSPAYSAVLLESMGYYLAREPYVFSALLPSSLARSLDLPGVTALLVGGERRLVPAWQDGGNEAPLGWAARLSRRADGSHALSGRKVFVPAWDADCALIVSAQRDGMPCLVQLPSGAQGVEATPRRMADGSVAADIMFNELSVTESMILATGPSARQAAEKATLLATLGLAIQLHGLARGALATTATYVNQRKQFGQAIGQFQAIRHRVADIAIAIAQAGASWRVALNGFVSNADHADPANSGDHADVAHLAPAVSAAKVACANAALFAARQAIQLHGAIGYTEEADPGQYLNAALTWSTQLGGTLWHLERIAASNFKIELT
ncbi:acyl-CoA dehydrogenase family protein [soil metagenome]